MITYISCAKIMTGKSNRDFSIATKPFFELQANANAVQMASYSISELKNLLKINADIAQENWLRYQQFFNEDNNPEPAVFSYDGMVFQKLAPETFSDKELYYANSHLLIGSFLYGLLRPLDLIKKYRLEGNVVLPENKGEKIFDFWKPLLTDYFIKQIKADDGILINLASDEMKNLFDWKKITREVKVITPEFHIIRNGKQKTIVIYTKMCRGAMTRYILKKRITCTEDLKAFEYEGFHWYQNSKGFEFNLIS